MVDKLKRSLEQLEAPICPTCRIEMRWTRSTLVAHDTIVHLFACPNCHRVEETKSSVLKIMVPPDKLSAPAGLRAA